MRRWTLGGLAATLVVLGMVGVRTDRSPDAPGEPDGRVEIDRIRAHLARAADVLRASEPAHLTEEQREARRATVAWLDEYRRGGVFPHNHVRTGRRTPVFVDPHGTPCAVGYLMLRSGEDALVEEIVRTDNLVHVPELSDDPRVAGWLESRGITLDEAAMIQPQYRGQPWEPAVREWSSYGSATVAVSVATAAVSTYAAMVGADDGAPLVDALFFATTVGHSYLLLDTRDNGPEVQWATALNAVGLVASIGLELNRVLGRGDDRSGTASITPRVRPGPFGTQVGLSLRH